MEMDKQDKSVLRHDHYPANAAEYEAELTETETEYEAKLEATEEAYTEKLEAVEESAKKQAQRYILWGSLSVIVNISMFYVFYRMLGIEYQIANFMAWVLSVQCAFWVDRMIVFKHQSSHPFREMGTFYGTRVVTYILESAILWIGISLLGIPGTFTKIIGHGLAVVGNFFLSKLVVFRKK
ncbi:GtrA family protein [Lactiplantibacillus mudanjiangensis]|uniref:Putative membrane protein [Lactobacillus brevis ATCC 367] n=1 Tax=Lactiplantibacillus mudanjiangensis TaxID=1296538 RepID=A0A660EBA1_9LACO|nr:GtrA family protein [Lactiplantibacillus mudanjiangensis]VDG20220.1 putative membrane protein [Lactobacillus brevis ATCC 367] [Lactiplantibacillus mudanjiangensis]VDG24086.1 putative membrane protein [Lactobacillus brevis ATCC 367] [Lactiplantibacillus mudanjiangensis]VDG30265.1 putative membrane protein [Lactobacillus brevis ATCC 367] [Lactiplantibacillus mudanjiangensis]VDG33814.1 putative membrane protein [Lactobacillus brevis ATCC 367] [Lactiplantibacillus mudanjiangensis]